MHCREVLYRGGCRPRRVLDVTPRVFRPKTIIRDSGGAHTYQETAPRGLEIQKWLDGYERQPVESFVIIDDESDMEHLTPRLVKTAFECGLTRPDAELAIALLSEVSV